MQLTPPDSGNENATHTVEPFEPEEQSQVEKLLPPIDDDRKLILSQKAKGFVQDLKNFNPNSPEFQEKLQDVKKLASTEIVSATSSSSRLLERASTSVVGSKKDRASASQRVANNLADLREKVEYLTPSSSDLSLSRKFFGLLPGGNKVRKFFQRWENSKEQLQAIQKAILVSQDDLLKDNAALKQEEKQLWDNMQVLYEYGMLATKMDEELVATAVQLRDAGNIAGAQALENDMLFSVRQRRQDIMTQLAVSAQSYMAMGLTRKGNEELIHGVDRAKTVTMTALQTAMTVAAALDHQRNSLDQLEAIKKTTEKAIESNAEMLKQNATDIHRQATSSVVSIEVLEKAFNNVFETIDEIERFRSEANDELQQTINGLETQISRIKPNMERLRQIQQSSDTDSTRAINS